MNLKPQTSMRRFSIVGAALLLLMASITNANDNDQPIEISADQVTREEPSGLTTYRGSVDLRQGSMEIKSDSSVFSFDKQGASVITATGSPATLKQMPATSDGPIEAQANAKVEESNERKARAEALAVMNAQHQAYEERREQQETQQFKFDTASLRPSSLPHCLWSCCHCQAVPISK